MVERNAGAVSQSADAEVFSPSAVPSGGAPIGEGPDCCGAHGHPRGMAREVFGRKYAVGLTTAVAGEMSPAVFAGAVSPADLARTEVPVIAKKELSAVAEARSLADDAEGSPSSIRVSKQLWAVVENIVTVPEPIEHSVDQMPSEEGGGLVNIVPVPMEHSVDRKPSEGEIVRWTL